MFKKNLEFKGEKQDKYESEFLSLSIKLYCGTVWENLSIGGLETTFYNS